MDALMLGAVSGVLAQVYSIRRRLADNLHSAPPPECKELFSRIIISLKLLQALFPENIGDRALSQFSDHLRGRVNRLDEVMRYFAADRGLLQKTTQVASHRKLLDLLRDLVEEIEAATQMLQNLEQRETLGRIEHQLHHLAALSTAQKANTTSSVTEILKAVGAIKDQILHGASEEEEILKAQKLILDEYPDMPVEEQQRTLENIRGLLHLQLRGRRLTRDRWSVPFVIPIPQGDDIKARVKLDTGTRPNWIHATILEKAGLSYEQAYDARQFIGAGHEARPFSPLGQASVTWFSDNRVVTRTNLFLVHNGSIPYDIVLGEDWISEHLTNEELAEPMLAIRPIISPGELRTIHQHAVEDGRSNDEIKKFQRLQNKAKRAEQRQSKANLRAISEATYTAETPRPPLSPSRSGATSVLSRRMSTEFFSMSPVAPQQTPAPFSVSSNKAGQLGTSPSGTSQPLEVGESSASATSDLSRQTSMRSFSISPVAPQQTSLPFSVSSDGTGQLGTSPSGTSQSSKAGESSASSSRTSVVELEREAIDRVGDGRNGTR